MITEGMTIMSTDLDRTIAFNDCWARIVPQFCFAIASFTAAVGVSLGIYMGIAHDFTLTPVHAHLNLLGWVSLFLMGLYYRFHEYALGKAAAAQVAIYAVGYIALTSGMAGMFLGYREAFFFWTLAGAIMVWTGVVMFFIIVVVNRRRV
jgi:hypothetical protein